jgi:hypothetical protein
MIQPGGLLRHAIFDDLVVRTAITVLVATPGYGQAPPPSYQFSSAGAALNIPVELIANGLVL